MIQNSKWYTPSDSFGQYHAEMLLYSFYGGIDAGGVGAMVVEQLLSSLPHRSVAKFALENVLDYRSRRPRLVIENWHIKDMQMPTCELLEITDYSGKKFLLLHGVEPDINWLDFSIAILEVAKECGVKKAIDIMGVASNMPHTRMPFIHHTAPEGIKLPDQSQAPGNFVFTSTFGQYLQVGFQKVGISSRGMLVGVPYYLADGQFPPGSVAAVEFLNKQFQLDLPLGDLAAASNHMQNELNRQIADNEEVAQMIAMLEQHYDKSTPNEWGNLPGGRIGVARQMTDGDKIAERLERFLRDVDLGKGGSGFKDLERNTSSVSSASAPKATNVVPSLSSDTPVENSSVGGDKIEFKSSYKAKRREKETVAGEVDSNAVAKKPDALAGSVEEMPPIFKQMYAEKNPYEIWNRPSMISHRVQDQTARSSLLHSDTSETTDQSSRLESTASDSNLQTGKDVGWIPRQKPSVKRYPRRRPEEKKPESRLYPWRQQDI